MSLGIYNRLWSLLGDACSELDLKLADSSQENISGGSSYNNYVTLIRNLEDTLKMKFDISDGPFFSTLERSLQQLNVKRQAYQGGTFVGNHVHKLLNVSM